MDNNFDTALSIALEKEFAWLENFEKTNEKHEFSPGFEEKMNKIFSMSEYTYISVGKKRIRKSVFAALVALFILIATGCAAVTSHLIITWHETENNSQGTMDVTFDIKNNSLEKAEFQCITPNIPLGYTVTDIQQDLTTYAIEYSDDKGNTIYYSQNSDVENMGLSIDNENANLEEVNINGYKGYSYKKEGMTALIWTDGIYLYTLQGTCKMKVLKEMTKTIN